MRIKNIYTRQSLRSLEGEWKEIMLIFQQLCTSDRRILQDGTILERVKTDSLSPETFLNCVATIVEQINNDFGAMDVKDIYNKLDKDLPHRNETPSANATEYEYCCNTFYERTIIFAAVYYIISVQNPELTEVLTAVYSNSDYKEARPYLHMFVFKLRQRNVKIESGQNDLDEMIPPHIIPDIQALNDGYRHLSPRRRLNQFLRILHTIDTMRPEEITPRISTLRIIVEYTILNLRRTYDLWEDKEYIPETEKIAMGDMIKDYQNHFANQKEAILPFIQHLISQKQPAAYDNMYQQKLMELDQPNTNINITIENKLEFNGPVANAIAKVEHLNTEKP